MSMDFRLIENYSAHLVAGEDVDATEYPKWAVFHLNKQISPDYPTRLEAENWLEQKNIGLSKEHTEYGFYVALVDEDCIAESRKQRIRDICEKGNFAISLIKEG